MARLSISLIQLTLLSIFFALFSSAVAQTGSTGSIVTTATSNGTYSKPTQAQTGTSTAKTTSGTPATTSSLVSGAGVVRFTGAGNEVFALLFAGVVGGAVFGL